MTTTRAWTGVVLAALAGVPMGLGAGADQPAQARGDGGRGGGGARGGGGGFSGGGGSRGGGGFSGGGFSGGGFSGGAGPNRGGASAGRAQTGFQPAGGGFDRGSSRPTGGWSNRVSSPQARPSLDRPSTSPGGFGGNGLNPTGRPGPGQFPANGAGIGANRPGTNRPGTLPATRPGYGTGNLNGNRYANRTVNRNWSNTVNINNVNVRPGWARPGWGVARPWNTGWYGGWGSPPWGWWGARAAVWGIGSLATAAAINNAVNASIAAQTTYIVVPESDFQLLYGSVQPSGSSTINFAVSANGSTYQLTADCNAGLLNGADPASAAEAQLLNAACQVAFGNA